MEEVPESLPVIDPLHWGASALLIACMRITINTLLILLLLYSNCLHAGSFDPARLQGLGDTRYHQFESEILGRMLHIYVRVPESC